MMPIAPRRYRSLLLLAIVALATALAIHGCASSSTSSSTTDLSAPLVTNYIPYEDIDRREFVDAGVRVRTSEGNRVSVEVAERDTLVWFENEHTGRFTRAFLRRGNTIYVLRHNGDYLRATSSQEVAYQLFMKAWHQADATGESVTMPSYADEQ